MNHLRKLMVTVLISTLLLSLCGCSSLIEKFDNQDIRQPTEKMLDSLIADDRDAAYILVQDYCTEEEFASAFPQMQEYLGQPDTYELKLLSIYTNGQIVNGQQHTITSATYELITDNRKTIVAVQKSNTSQCMQTFRLTPYELTDYYFTGTLQTMKDANILQWIILLSNFISFGFVIFAIADCCRQDIPKKVLWILLSVLGFFTIGVTIARTGIHLNFNLGWITSYSALIRYGSGTKIARLMLPVGAIIYLMKRHALLNGNTPKTSNIPETVSGESSSNTDSL